MELYQPLIHFDWNLLFSMLTFICLFLILKHFFFDKVHNFMVARQQKVDEQLKHAEEAQAEADERLASYEDIIEKAESDGRDIIKQSKNTAEERADGIIADAKAQADMIIRNAEKKAEQEKAKALTEMKDHIAELAILAAGQIVEKEIADNGEEVIIDKIIEEAGAGKWQN